MSESSAVVWIDTDGKFKLQGCDDDAQALQMSRMTNECGLPCVVIYRQEVIDGEMKNNSQMEFDEELEPELNDAS